MNEDENLTPALNDFRQAVHALVGPTIEYIDGTVHTGDSLYLQLTEAIECNVAPGGGGGAKSKAPLWIDGLDTLIEIDAAVSIWQTSPNVSEGIPATVWRLQVLAEKNYRPQDTKMLQQMTEALVYWATEINALLNPKPLVHLHGYACPYCKLSIVYRWDKSGERVRQPALVFDPAVGLACQNRECRQPETQRPAFWPKEHALFAGRLLQCPTPEGLTA